MKKKPMIVLCVVVVLIVGILAYFELRYSVTRRVYVDMTAEEILAELPEAAVSENDMALRDALYADPAVQAAFGNLTEPGDTMKVDNQRVRALRDAYCPQAESMNIELMNGALAYVDWRSERQIVYMNFTADGIMSKRVYVNDGKDDFIRYDCDADGNLTKEMTKRIWFGFLKYWNFSGPECEPNPFA